VNTENNIIHDTEEIDTMIRTMSDQLKDYLSEANIENPAMVGIHTGGAWIAEKLHALLGIKEPLGSLDISFYRDDFSRIGVNPVVKPSELPFSLDDRHLILVDDVLQSGRTIRAALNELFDYGRPASVILTVLVDRGCRELPIEAPIVGTQEHLQPNEQITLTGPEPLRLILGKGSNRNSRDNNA